MSLAFHFREYESAVAFWISNWANNSSLAGHSPSRVEYNPMSETKHPKPSQQLMDIRLK